MSRRSKAVAGLLVAVCVLGSAEGVARLVTGAPEVPVVVSMPDGSEGLWQEVGGELRPKLVEHQEWWPVGDKQPGRLRVVLLGGSSLAAPPDDRRRAASLLAKGIDAEVINLAVSGMDSGHLLATLPGVVALEPDLVIIYSGHNDLGNAVFEQRYADIRSVALARARAVLGHSRLFELLEAGLRGREERTMTQHFAVAEVSLSDGQRAAAIADFEDRLGQLVGGLTEAGLPVVLSTVVSNPAFPSVQWRCPDLMRSLGAEPSHRAVVDLSAVDSAALAAAREQSPCADLDLVWARRAFDAGDAEQAVEMLERLRDEDPVPLRAPRATNAAVRRVADAHGVPVVDVAAEFRKRGGGVEPPGWFKDQVHVNELGELALAAAFAVAVTREAGGAVTELTWPPVPDKGMSECLSRRCPGQGRPDRPVPWERGHDGGPPGGPR